MCMLDVTLPKSMLRVYHSLKNNINKLKSGKTIKVRNGLKKHIELKSSLKL